MKIFGYLKDKNFHKYEDILRTNPSHIFSLDGEGNTVLVYMITNEWPEKYIRDALKRGVDVNKKNKSGLALLHFINFSPFRENVSELIMKYNADLNIVCDNGLYPVHYAVLNENADFLKSILKFGANPNALTKGGITPLFISMTKKLEIMKILLDHKADVNHLMNRVTSYLEIAILYKKPHACMLLLDYNCSNVLFVECNKDVKSAQEKYYELIKKILTQYGKFLENNPYANKCRSIVINKTCIVCLKCLVNKI